MADRSRKNERLNARPLEPEKLIAHLEAALPEAEFYDATAGFLLRLAIHGLRKKHGTRQSSAA
jgi:hypothetical protein